MSFAPRTYSLNEFNKRTSVAVTTGSSTERLERLFNPRNVALVGASDRAGHWSERIWGNLRRFGYSGPVFPVNPNRKEIWGVACYPDLDSLPERPDHLAIFIPKERTVALLKDSIRFGIGGATIFAAGFGEGGDPSGRRLGAELHALLKPHGIPAVGPNCMGLACGRSRFSTIPDETLLPLETSPVAVITQSGALCAAINRAINDIGLKLSYLISCGNQTVCTVADYVDYLADDPKLKVILCYIEGLPDGQRFLAAAKRAQANGKVTVAVKIGGSEAGRAAALAHTGSLAGTSEAFDVFAHDAGVVRLNTLDEGIEAIEFFARSELPRGNKIAILTGSGALRSLSTEAAERTGARFATLSDATQGKLAEILEDPQVSNPVDTKMTLPTPKYMACVQTLADAAEVDLLLVTEDLPREAGVDRKVSNVKALSAWVGEREGTEASRVPIALYSSLTFSPTPFSVDLRASIPNLPILREPEKTLRVMKAIADLGAHRHRDMVGLDGIFNPELAASWREHARSLAAPAALNESDSKKLLQAYGIPVPSETTVQTPEQAVSAAAAIGFPVVLKGVSSTITHKSDAGLVLLNLRDAQAVKRGVDTLLERASKLGTKLQGILVAQQVQGGLETVLGVHRDPEMGPVVMFGLGGVMVELFKDVAFASPQIDEKAAADLINATQAGKILAGYRGANPGDRDALCRALVALGALARDLGDIVESIDVNPFLVRLDGQGACALDALVVLRPPLSL
jgi:acetate---CoA ligase (ADP-forming)